MKWKTAIAVSIFLNTVLILWGRGGFVSVLIPLALSMYLGLPLLILSIIMVAISSRRTGVPSQHEIPAGIRVALLIVSTLVSIPIGAVVCRSELCRAETFCEKLVPRLEALKVETGFYPRSLQGVLGGRSPPVLVGLPYAYWSDGTNFAFHLEDRASFMGGFEYGSRSKTWQRWN